MSSFHTNRDGRLSRGEFVDGPTRLFDLGDRDGNGRLDPQEIARMQKRGGGADLTTPFGKAQAIRPRPSYRWARCSERG